jgi:hypothetical protein
VDIHFGNCIRAAHKKTGIPLKDIADTIGCERANYSHLLAQKGMLAHTFFNVCAALGMTMDEVVGMGDNHGSQDNN